MIQETERLRAERYLTMATENASHAARCDDPAATETYLRLASVWLRLARDAAAQWSPGRAADAEGLPDGAAAPNARSAQ